MGSMGSITVVMTSLSVTNGIHYRCGDILRCNKWDQLLLWWHTSEKITVDDILQCNEKETLWFSVLHSVPDVECFSQKPTQSHRPVPTYLMPVLTHSVSRWLTLSLTHLLVSLFTARLTRPQTRLPTHLLTHRLLTNSHPHRSVTSLLTHLFTHSRFYILTHSLTDYLIC